ncbi:Uncharacterized protein TCM_017142 [Theobroma cacao]|uniref:Cysteine-rich RLK (RECEPTOR-like protein kinase) 8 n=1 Tax=Theobroma cacao TaxID=3641 RepID=A0A061EKF1_THECC|nr:Uncharacterized protein TCM_017142 [Theobroma cacao]
MDKPSTTHLQAAYRVLKYLKKASRQGILLAFNSNVQEKVFTDSDWVGCLDFRRFVTGFGVFLDCSSSFFCDNQSAIHICKNPIFHERTKHIELDCHFIHDKVLEGVICPQHISTKDQLADIFTKALPPVQFTYLLGKMSIDNIHAPLKGGARYYILTCAVVHL